MYKPHQYFSRANPCHSALVSNIHILYRAHTITWVNIVINSPANFVIKITYLHIILRTLELCSLFYWNTYNALKKNSPSFHRKYMIFKIWQIYQNMSQICLSAELGVNLGQWLDEELILDLGIYTHTKQSVLNEVIESQTWNSISFIL